MVGVIPRFMYDLEWVHRGLTELKIVADVHERKRFMMETADAIVALPGGSGTLEELIEAITWKRLGLYLKPIVLVNIRRFFDPCIELLERCIRERFMDQRHRAMWSVVEKPEDVFAAIGRRLLGILTPGSSPRSSSSESSSQKAAGSTCASGRVFHPGLAKVGQVIYRISLVALTLHLD